MKNLCTCPAAVDITFTGHLPDCPQPKHEARYGRARRSARAASRKRPSFRQLFASARRTTAYKIEGFEIEIGELKIQLRTLRRQKTCLEKRVRALEAQRCPEVLRVVRWARRFMEDFDIANIEDWDGKQLKRAVVALNKLPFARLNAILTHR